MTNGTQADARSVMDEAMIERLVRAFYGRARLDTLIGPIFEAKVHDWDAHTRRAACSLQGKDDAEILSTLETGCYGAGWLAWRNAKPISRLAARRLALAAKTGGSLGLLLRQAPALTRESEVIGNGDAGLAEAPALPGLSRRMGDLENSPIARLTDCGRRRCRAPPPGQPIGRRRAFRHRA